MKNNLKIFIALLLVFSLLSPYFPLSSNKAEANTAGWLTGWDYRRAITIDNTGGGALTDYQVSIDTNSALYNESGLVGSWHMNEEFSDNNLIDPSTWVIGTGSVTGFSVNGSDTENNRIFDTDPFGNSAVIWEAQPDATSGADGGWNSSNFNIDNTKMYRFSVWVKRPVTGNGHFYLGTHGYGSVDGVLNRSDGANNTNPYFTINSNWSEWGDNNSWYLVVGHVWPAGSGTGSNHSDSGIYDINGNLVYTADLADFVWRPETTASNHRSYLYYSTDTSTRQLWAYPRVDLIDGNEPSIQELLRNAPSKVCNDSSGNSNDGVAVNFPVTTTGKYGSALSFDGVDDYVSLGSSNNITGDNLQTITISAWLKTGATINQYALSINRSSAVSTLISLSSNQDSAGNNVAGYLGFVTAKPDGTGHTWLVYNGAYNDNKWHHITAVVNGSTRALYIDGVNRGSDNEGMQSVVGNTSIASIGSHGGTGSFFNGSIDEVRIYNRALSEDEILAHFNASKVRLDYGDVRFTDSDGTTLLNYWMEQDGTFWVKVPSIPASSQKTIYMYYGNASADSTSSYTNTATTSNTSYSYQGDTGLVGEWRMENNWNDTSGNNNNGTGSGGVGFTSSSRFGSYAGNFDGSDDSVDLGNPASLQITGNQTIVMWLKPTSRNARRNPYAKAYGGEGTITQETNCSLSYYYGTAGGNTTPYQGFGSGAGTVAIDLWTHVAIVRDLTNMKLKWYKNGNLINETNASYEAATASSLNAYIGSGYVSNYAGLIDEVRIYNRALSATEIAAQYLGRKYASPEPTISVGSEAIENEPPAISSVSDTPDPLQAGNYVSFEVSWSDPNDGDQTKIHICKTDAITGQTCDGGSWCDTTEWSVSSPTSCEYTTQVGDIGIKNYYAFIADDSDAVSTSTAGTFEVITNATPTISSVTDAPDPVPTNTDILFTVNWSDSGDRTKIHICKTDAITGQTCDNGSWCDSSEFSTSSPSTCTYTAQLADLGTQNYYAFVCDSVDNCSMSKTATFEVVHLNESNSLTLATTTSSGFLLSSILDSGVNGGASFHSLLWQGTLCSGCVVKFQLASSNSSSGPWTYYGPTSTSDYYSPNPGVAITLPRNGNAAHQNKRYIRYKVYLEPYNSQSPKVDDIIINWTP